MAGSTRVHGIVQLPAEVSCPCTSASVAPSSGALLAVLCPASAHDDTIEFYWTHVRCTAQITPHLPVLWTPRDEHRVRDGRNSDERREGDLFPHLGSTTVVARGVESRCRRCRSLGVRD